MGYVAAFSKDDMIPPVALVLTQTCVDFLFFPFVNKNGRLLTAAHLQLDEWENSWTVNRNCLNLLAMLALGNFRLIQITHSQARSYEEMRNIKVISEEKSLQQQLDEQTKQTTELKRKPLKDDKDKLPCIYCEANDLIKLPSLETDPVSKRV